MAVPDLSRIPASVQPKPSDYGYDLERALTSVVTLSSRVPPEAFTADTLGTERAGNGVVIDEDGLVLTVGYLVMEAESVWLTTHDGRSVPAHVVGFDAVTGFGLVQALGRLDLPALAIGRSAKLQIGDKAVVAGAGGRGHSVAVELVARQEFAGYWEYVLDEALFTAPAHPHWGGTALIGPDGDLLGIGSLQLQQGSSGRARAINMVVPIDLLLPILDELRLRGRTTAPPRPWLGLYATETDNGVVVMGVVDDGPAQAADLRPGDILSAVAGEPVADLAGFFRQVWALGEAGARVPLSVHRDGRQIALSVMSGDRDSYLMQPMLH
ncbi:S1C family serine protease [Methylobacterium gnaphalii]|uniref:Serine protease n=1 Tax=Methylobacterium gnaphalii TaxID=1010610 RepID=A0A512JPJ0_9HYPH|nr:S1C family serine protease [Methylobacterium gnaphalii]GEP11876.1 serine protease [Methylobacterium gnaphalii]GJD68944.1 Putative serine protease HtrA [Methylobacterium gnaphalii]GLS47689.1 serine protease [Methylobacterium gnaphalii]